MFVILNGATFASLSAGSGEVKNLLRDSSSGFALPSQEDLLNWLRTKVQRGFISIQEMNVYLEKTLDVLLKKHSLSKLNANRYQVKEAIENKIDQIVDSMTTKKFTELVKDKLIAASGECFNFAGQIRLVSVCRDNFNNHLYEKSGKMNTEELELAYQLDGLDNIYWWFRNPEMNGFYIQGWLKGKFYPDFVVKTQKDNYFILEYKGEHLLGADDAEYKAAVGKKWQELAGRGYRFELVEKNKINAILEVISKS